MHNFTMDLLKTIKRGEVDRLITHHEDHYITSDKWKKQAEKGKVSKELYRHDGWIQPESAVISRKPHAATAIDSPMAHAAVLDIDLNVRRACGRTSKLMLLERGA